MWMVAAYRRTYSPSCLAWSEGCRPSDTESAFVKWTRWTLAMALSHDDRTINIVICIIFPPGMTQIRLITKYYKISWNDLPPHQQSSHEAELRWIVESTHSKRKLLSRFTWNFGIVINIIIIIISRWSNRLEAEIFNVVLNCQGI